MADQNDDMTPEAAHLAIERASQRTPAVAAVRAKLNKLASDDNKGIEMLANAIKRLLREG